MSSVNAGGPKRLPELVLYAKRGWFRSGHFTEPRRTALKNRTNKPLQKRRPGTPRNRGFRGAAKGLQQI